MADEAPGLRADHAAVAHEVHGGRRSLEQPSDRCGSGQDALPSSESSTNAPSTSPVRPPRRRARRPPPRTPAARAPAAIAAPRGPAAQPQARTRGRRDRAGPARGSRRGRLRRDPGRVWPGEPRGPTSSGASRPTAGASSSSGPRAGPEGSPDSGRQRTTGTAASPSAPKTPMRLSRMIASLRSAFTPASPSRGVGEPVEMNARPSTPSTPRRAVPPPRAAEPRRRGRPGQPARPRGEADDGEPPRGAPECSRPPGPRVQEPARWSGSARQGPASPCPGAAAATPLRQAGRDCGAAGTRAAWTRRRRGA